MAKRIVTVLLLLALIAGAIGAAVSIAMVISAVRFSEWGRVVFYSVTMAVCVEIVVLVIVKLRNKESS